MGSGRAVGSIEALSKAEWQVGRGDPARGRDTLSQGVEVPVCCGKGERGKLPGNGVS